MPWGLQEPGRGMLTGAWPCMSLSCPLPVRILSPTLSPFLPLSYSAPVQCALYRCCGACRNYYAEVWVRHADWKEAEFFEELPAHLRGDVAAFLMDEVFEQSDFFRCLLDTLYHNHLL